MARPKKQETETAKEIKEIKEDMFKMLEKVCGDGTRSLEDQKEDYVVKEWFDTGNCLFNAQLSTYYNGGVCDNRITQFSGESSTGKSFLAWQCIKDAIKKGWKIIYIDTEGDLDYTSVKNMGIDPSKILLLEGCFDASVMKNKLLKIIESLPKEPKILIVIDSIGNQSSAKEFDDSIAEKDTADMTRQKIYKSMFRLIARRAFKKRIPIILINHVYALIGSYVPTSQGSSGTGIRYNSSVIAQFSKGLIRNEKDKTDKNIYGAKITSLMDKNRLAVEKTKITFSIDYKRGILKYSGLLDYMIEHKLVEVVKRKTNVYIIKHGDKILELLLKDLSPNNAEVWEDILNNYGLAEHLKETFSYSDSTRTMIEEDFEDEDDENENE